MKVRFNLKDSGGLILLKFRYIRGGLPFVYSTRQHINKKDWNKKTMRAIVRNSLTDTHLVHLNRLLQNMEDKTLAFYLSNTGTLTRQQYKQHLDSIFFPTEKKEDTIIAFLRGEMQQQKRASETLANYRHVSNVLQKYQTARHKEMSFKAINFEWIESFRRWCFDNDYSSGSVGKFVSNIKTAVNLARDLGLTDTKVEGRGFAVKKTKGNKLTLWTNEIEAIANFDFTQVASFNGIKGDTLQKGADIIIIGCATGMRHSDLCKLKKENIKPFRKRELIEVWTQKTNKLVAIPMKPELKALMEKYNYQLPTMSRSWLLRVGRAVLECAGINRQVAVKSTKGGKVTVEHVPIYTKFSAHMTRRTFATESYLTDPALLPAIRAILGHTTDAQTLDYINVEDRLSAEHFAKRIEIKPNNIKAIRL